MSKITNDSLTCSGTGCFIAVQISNMAIGNSECQKVNLFYRIVSYRSYDADVDSGREAA